MRTNLARSGLETTFSDMSHHVGVRKSQAETARSARRPLRAVFEALTEPRSTERIVEQFWTPRPVVGAQAATLMWPRDDA